MPASARAIRSSTSGSSARPRLLMLVARSPGPITATSMPGGSHDLVDAFNRLDMLDGDHADHVVVRGRHIVRHRDAPAKRRVKRTPEPFAARRIAHAAHGFFGLLRAADHRKIDAESADIHR